MSVQEHKMRGPSRVSCFVLTVSDTRTEDTDTSGQAIEQMLTEAGHFVAGRVVVKDEPADVARLIADQLANADVQVIITTGGTGITSRDSTYEAVTALFDKTLDGFGELFRMLSYQDIGSAAMMSRATAGLAHGKIIVSLPGAEQAVRLGMSKLVIPELGHMVQQAGR